MPGPSSSPEHVRHPSPSPVPIPSRSRAASVSEVTGRRSQEDSASSAWKEKGKQRATDVLLENGTSPSPAKSNSSGSGRDAEADVDTSGEIRVRGKEQELSAVRAERRAREKWWETEAETTMIREEKAGYEDKIKKLEEEVMRLQEEVRYFILYMFPTNAPFKSWRRGLRRTLQITRFLCPRLRRLHLHRPHVYPLSFQGYQQPLRPQSFPSLIFVLTCDTLPRRSRLRKLHRTRRGVSESPRSASLQTKWQSSSRK